jgi:hypothetical protein
MPQTLIKENLRKKRHWSLSNPAGVSVRYIDYRNFKPKRVRCFEALTFEFDQPFRHLTLDCLWGESVVRVVWLSAKSSIAFNPTFLTPQNPQKNPSGQHFWPNLFLGRWLKRLSWCF